MPWTSKLPRLWIFIHQSWCFCQRRRPTQPGDQNLRFFTQQNGRGVNIFGCTLTSCKTAESLDTKPWTLHHKNEEMIVCWYGYFPDVSFSQIQLDALLYDVKLLTSGTSSHGYLMVGCLQNKGDVPLWKVIQMFKVSQSFYPAMCQPSSIYESVSKGILPWCHDVETSTAEIFI